MRSLPAAKVDPGEAGFFFLPAINGTTIPDHPLRLFQQGKYNKDVNVIVGTNEFEGNLFAFGTGKTPTQGISGVSMIA